MQGGLQGERVGVTTPSLHPHSPVLEVLQAREWVAFVNVVHERSGASWNVRSLVESVGSIATTSKSRHVVEDKKIERVVNILGRQKIDIAGLQETHWFGNSTYRVADRLVLTSGRALPVDGESCRRGEGVALVLNKMAEEAWRAGGCLVEQISSRLLVARLLFPLQNGKTQWLCVICAYAPTFRSARPI